MDFAAGMAALSAAGADVYLELGPSHTLVGMGRACGVEARAWLPSLVRGSDAGASLSEAVAGYYAAGGQPDWAAHYAGRGCRRISVPTYPFQGKDYWFEMRHPDVNASRSPAAGFLTIAPAMKIQEFRVADLVRYGLTNHKVYDLPVCPGAFLLSQSLCFYRLTHDIATGDNLLVAENTLFKRPLLLDDLDLVVQFQLQQQHGFATLKAFAQTGQNEWDEFFRIDKLYHKVNDGKKSPDVSSPFNGAGVTDYGEREVYEILGRAGLNVDGDYLSLASLSTSAAGFRATVNSASPIVVGDPGALHLLIDGILQSAVFCQVLARHKSDDSLSALYVPFAVERCEIHPQLFNRELAPAVECRGRASDPHSKGYQETDMRLTSAGGDDLLSLQGVSISRVSDNTLMKSDIVHGMSDAFSIEWRKLSFPNNLNVGPGKIDGLCLLFANTGEKSELLKSLNSVFSDVLVIYYSEQFLCSDGEVHLDIYRGEHWDTLVGQLKDRVSSLRCVVNTWCLPDGVMGKGADSFAAGDFLMRGPKCLFHFIRGLSRLSDSAGWYVSLVFVTKQGVTYDKGLLTDNPQPGFVSGLVNGLNQEYTWFRAAQVDLPESCCNADLGRAEPVFVKTLYYLLQHHAQSTSGYLHSALAIRDSCVFEPDLFAENIHSPPVDRFLPNELFIVTGGTGDLGVVTAQWLLGRGAKKVALLQRTETDANKQKVISKLEEKGCEIITVACDIRSRDEVENAVSGLVEKHGSISGVVHAAGILTDGLIANAKWDDFEQPFTAKCRGAINLIHALKGVNLRFFISYSSISSLVGTPGQANYAMANGFLNMLACTQGYDSLHLKSINWGPWENKGMARKEGVLENFRDRFGVLPVDVDYAFNVLNHVAGSESGSVFIAARFDERFKADKNLVPRMFEGVFNKYEDNVVATGVSEPNSGPSIDNERQLSQAIKRIVTEVMKLDSTFPLSESQTLQELGMDSVMALELQRKIAASLDIRLPASLFFDYPTISEASRFIFKRYFLKENDGKTGTTVSEAESATENWDEDSLQHLSDADLSRILAEELADIQSLGN
ncbi:SDR family NAD(P)-dependent oxidoreductase [Exilibacterium tricleocarpae]|uniref:SDR family NAD(P)-dependent oxidoreductase n=1 Tax=Exilibacterium tricleocarpae TaxID=2591008 RepID=A0A545SLH4_9GAMM|nr:SDR family NAD(P)-dependent oxidoreductase [Exilibacterium tricleocarpae]TQV65811.1 SDR family NAD(P)-dependent oxidoreductase [Exilibacterium tricleocarpae]